MHALQALGERLVDVPAARLDSIALPDGLREAVRRAHGISQFEARRRHMQYIGRLMRGVDPVPIREALAVLEGSSDAARARLHQLERLRERLLADEAVLGEIAQSRPHADLQRLRALRRNAVMEQTSGKPPRSYRELFRALRDLVEKDAPARAAPEPVDNLASKVTAEGEPSCQDNC